MLNYDSSEVLLLLVRALLKEIEFFIYIVKAGSNLCNSYFMHECDQVVLTSIKFRFLLRQKL